MHKQTAATYRMTFSDAQTLSYRVRISLRAKRIRLTISARNGLIVVLPRRCGLQQIPPLLEEKKEWIALHLGRFAELRKRAAAAPAELLPALILLPALGEQWPVAYLPTAAKTVAVRTTASGSLAVQGAVTDIRACQEALQRWLARRTREQLVPRLTRLSLQSGLAYSRAVVRGQRTRWASCSGQGTISLNYKLLFLPSHLVGYILMHELCHTRHMNHAEKFWALVRGFEPACKDHDKELRKGWQLVPAWADGIPGEGLPEGSLP
jgi:predicted metal-dependent hydrolase